MPLVPGQTLSGGIQTRWARAVRWKLGTAHLLGAPMGGLLCLVLQSQLLFLLTLQLRVSFL